MYRLLDERHPYLCNGLADMHALTLRQMRPQRSSSGSAFVTDTAKRHIMTNSHVVSSTNPEQYVNEECHVFAVLQQSSFHLFFSGATMAERDWHSQATSPS